MTNRKAPGRPSNSDRRISVRIKRGSALERFIDADTINTDITYRLHVLAERAEAEALAKKARKP